MKDIGTNIQFGQHVRIPDGDVEGVVIGINLDEHGEPVFTIDCGTDGIYDPMHEHEITHK
jgi:hypothetical protein